MRGLLPCLLAFAPVAPAQTFVVDAQNGPGASFTDLPAAVAAVPDGAVLLVRPGTYSGFAVAGKGLQVLGVGAVIQGSITIRGTAPGQDIALRGLSWSVVPAAAVVQLTNCQGPVLLEGLTLPATPYQWSCTSWFCPIATGIQAVSCAQLCLRHCSVGCTVELSACDAVVESCWIRGEDYAAIYSTSPPFGNPARTALTATNSNVQIGGSSRLLGGDGGNLGLGNQARGGSGVKVQDGSLRLLDGDVVGGVGGWMPYYYSYTVEVAGTVRLRISPRVVLTGAFGWPTQGPQSGSDVMPALTGAGAPTGGALSATVATEVGDLVALAAGLPGPAALVPGIPDPFWLDAVVHELVAIGVQQAGAPVGAALAVPAGPTFVGVRLHWGAACLGPATGLQASNPVVTLVH